MPQNRTGLRLRDIGPSACTLYGYPGISWVAGADGHQVGAAAVRQAGISGGAEKTVTLAAHRLASAPLDIVAAAVIPQSLCKLVPVRGLRVYPPGEKAALFVPLPPRRRLWRMLSPHEAADTDHWVPAARRPARRRG